MRNLRGRSFRPPPSSERNREYRFDIDDQGLKEDQRRRKLENCCSRRNRAPTIGEIGARYARDEILRDAYCVTALLGCGCVDYVALSVLR